jgi:RHS repeat-associated protein
MLGTYYPSDGYQIKTDGEHLNERKYYAFGTTTVAMRENDEALTWLLTDQINSTTVTVSEDGTLVSEVKYTAFGEVRSINGVMVTDSRYTGQREEVEIGLYYYVARFYDPYLNRWIQPDTIVPEPYNSLDWDRYSYVGYNPVKYYDPSGHMRSGEDSYYPGNTNNNNPVQSGLVILDVLFRNPRSWDELTDSYKTILQEFDTSIDEEMFNNSEMAGKPGCRDAYWYEDPVVLIPAILASIRLAPQVFTGLAEYFCLNDGNCTNEIQIIDGIFPKNPGQLMHIFRDAVGHFVEDTWQNRELLLQTIRPENFIYMDEYGKLIFARLLENGKEIWVYTLNGIIQNGGINQIPLYLP